MVMIKKLKVNLLKNVNTRVYEDYHQRRRKLITEKGMQSARENNEKTPITLNTTVNLVNQSDKKLKTIPYLKKVVM